MCVGMTILHLPEPIVLTSRSLNFLEPSEPVQARTGIVLPCTLYIFRSYLSENTVIFHQKDQVVTAV